MKNRTLAAVGAVLALSVVFTLAIPLGTAITYQGRLTVGTNATNGSYDLKFGLYGDASGGSAVAGPLTNSSVALTNGIFTTALDFGINAFNGGARWLELAVRTNGGGAFTTLSPRQPVEPLPYALFAPNAGTAITATTAASANSVAAANITGTISPNNIGAGSITTTMLAAGAVGPTQLAAGAVTTATLADGAVTAAKMAKVSALKIPNPNPAAYSFFGTSVAALGTDRVLIGGNLDNGGVGVAYLFGTDGTLLTTFTSPTALFTGYFGCAVAAVGSDRVLIGALQDNVGAAVAGGAYLFSTNGTLLTTFTNPTPAYLDHFGFSVAAVGNDRVLIGARLDDTGATDAGAAYLFRTDGILLTTFTNPAPVPNGYFGYSVAGMGNDRVLIGADEAHVGAADAGAVYLFSTNGTLLTTFTNPSPAIYDGFGCRVAAMGSDRVLIGASGDDWGATNAGVAYLFRANGTLLTTFTNPTPSAYDSFGISVAVMGSDRVLIGAYGDDTGAADAGAAYLFRTNGALLATFTNPNQASGDSFGWSVAAVGSDRVIIGAYGDSTFAPIAGAAYLLTIETFTPGLVAEAVRPGGVTADQLDPTIGVWTRAGSNVLHLAGNVGINTNDPQSMLHVAGGVTANTFTGSGAGLISLDAANLTSGTMPDARLSVNVARLNSDATFNGTVEARGDLKGRRLNIGTDHLLTGDLATIAGGESNANQSPHATIGGGWYNAIETGADLATVGGGRFNTIQAGAGNATIGGGAGNTVQANADGATVGGGSGNQIQTDAFNATVAGGSGNSIQASSWSATIGGGQENTIETIAVIATIGGGFGNKIQRHGWYATIGGGAANTAGGMYSTIAGGQENGIDGSSARAAVAGGWQNTNRYNSLDAFIAGGKQNAIEFGESSAIGGGSGNTIYASICAGISGGSGNTIQWSSNAVVSGGASNVIQQLSGYATISGGFGNEIQTDARNATVAGGVGNSIQPGSFSATIGGGRRNTNSGEYATVPGGLDNVATGHAFAAGTRAKAEHIGAFVWADGIDADFASTGTNQFLIRASGGVGINTNDPSGAALNVAGTVRAAAFQGDGAGLASLNASNLTLGIVPLPRLPGEVVTNNESGLTLNGTFSGNGGGLTGIPFSALPVVPLTNNQSGVAFRGLTTVSNLSVAATNFANYLVVTNPPALNGSALTQLNASQLTTGTVPLPRLPLEVVTNNEMAVTLGGTFSGNGTGLTNVNAVRLGGREASTFWSTSGNAGTTPGTHFIGTTDNQALELRVNGARAWRLQPGVSGYASVVGGAADNSVATFSAVIGGGQQNTIHTNAPDSTIGGGALNAIQPDAMNSTISGGAGNCVHTNAHNSTIGGGSGNEILKDAQSCTVGGGASNTNGGSYSTIPGGLYNVALGVGSLAAGQHAHATNDGVFVWGDNSTSSDVSSTNANSWTVRASGGVRFLSNSGLTSGVYLAPGAGGWTIMSDRASKENFQPVSPREVLAKVAALPVATWNYKSQAAGIRHIGPIAQDFSAAFGVGETDMGITTVDADGVALAAIQGLDQVLKEKDAEIQALKARLEHLEGLINAKHGGAK